MRNIKVEAIQFQRDELKKLYNRLTDKQQKFFNRLWDSVDCIPDKDIHIGFDQCQRTLIKNKQIQEEGQ